MRTFVVLHIVRRDIDIEQLKQAHTVITFETIKLILRRVNKKI